MLKVLLGSHACRIHKYQTVSLSRHHVTQMYDEEELRLHRFLISRQRKRAVTFTSQPLYPSNQWARGWLGLTVKGKTNISAPPEK
jgi:hypothetical protein